jgi:hypothetical protein
MKSIYGMYFVTFKLDGREEWGIQQQGGTSKDYKILLKDFSERDSLRELNINRSNIRTPIT